MESLRDILFNKSTNSPIAQNKLIDSTDSTRPNSNSSSLKRKREESNKSNNQDPGVFKRIKKDNNDMTKVNGYNNTPGPRRFQRKEFKRAKLFALGLPRDLVKEAEQLNKPFTGKRRYSIQVKFRDDNGIYHVRNVQFGNVKDKDFLHTRDELGRLRAIARLKHDDNFLHPNFYRLYLLNSNSTDLYESFKVLKETLKV